MGLTVSLEVIQPVEIFAKSITHNLTEMATKVGIYTYLWRADDVGICKAEELIEPLTQGLEKLRANPDFYRTFDASNGWGTYDDFVKFVEAYLAACIENPQASVRIDR